MDEREARLFEAAVARELGRAKKAAIRELGKVEGELRDTLGAVERYMKKNPRQTALVTLSLGAALGAAGALLVKCKKQKRTKNK